MRIICVGAPVTSKASVSENYCIITKYMNYNSHNDRCHINFDVSIVLYSSYNNNVIIWRRVQHGIRIDSSARGFILRIVHIAMMNESLDSDIGAQ